MSWPANLTSKVDELSGQNNLLSEKLQIAEARCQLLEDKVIALESASRRNNLKFLNVKMQQSDSESSHENCESTILEICANHGINIGPSEIERAHRIGHWNWTVGLLL